MGEREDERRREQQEAGSSLLFSHHSFLFLPLMSVLSINSQRVSVVVLNTHYSDITLHSHCSDACVRWCHWLAGDDARGAFRCTGIVGIHYVVSKKKFYLR